MKGKRGRWDGAKLIIIAKVCRKNVSIVDLTGGSERGWRDAMFLSGRQVMIFWINKFVLGVMREEVMKDEMG